MLFANLSIELHMSVGEFRYVCVWRLLGSVIRRGEIKIVCEVLDFSVLLLSSSLFVFAFVVEDSLLLGCNTVSLGLCLLAFWRVVVLPEHHKTLT